MVVVVVVGAPGRQGCAFVVLARLHTWTPKFGAEFQLAGGRIVEKRFEGSQPLFLDIGYYREWAIARTLVNYLVLVLHKIAPG